MNEKIDIYFKLLHPEYEGLSEEEQKRVLNDQTFIKENLDKIELMYQNACSNGRSPEEAIRGAVRLEKANRYFDMLHPNSELETLSEEEYKRVLSDKTFIKENLDKIELMYQNAYSNGISPEEAIRGAVRLEKTMDTDKETVKGNLSDKRISRALTFEEMHEATLKGGRGNFNLDQAIQTMLEYKARGESVSYRFNGFKLESDEISMDDIERIHEEYGKALSSKLPRELYAEEMREATLKGERGNFNLEQAVQAMLEYKAKDESVYYVFNGFELNSDEITTVEETIEKYDRFLRRDREPQKTMDTPEGIVKNEEIDSQGIMPIDEAKFAQIYGKAKGRIKEVFSKIKSFLNIKSNDRNDKTNDENIK